MSFENNEIVIKLQRSRVVSSKERKRKNSILVRYEAIASALEVTDNNGYPLPMDILSKTYDMVNSIGGDDPAAILFKNGYEVYLTSKNTPLGEACILTDELMDALAVMMKCTFVLLRRTKDVPDRNNARYFVERILGMDLPSSSEESMVLAFVTDDDGFMEYLKLADDCDIAADIVRERGIVDRGGESAVTDTAFLVKDDYDYQFHPFVVKELDKEALAAIAAAATKLYKEHPSLFLPIRKDPNRLQLECFNSDGVAKNSTIELVDKFTTSLGEDLTHQFEHCFADAKAFSAVIVVPSGAKDLECQHFHQDSKQKSRVANVLIACDSDDFHVDFLKDTEIQRVRMNHGEGVLFSDETHRGTAARGVRLHIRYELTRRGTVAENTWIRPLTFEIPEGEQELALQLPIRDFNVLDLEPLKLGTVYSFSKEVEQCEIRHENRKYNKHSKKDCSVSCGFNVLSRRRLIKQRWRLGLHRRSDFMESDLKLVDHDCMYPMVSTNDIWHDGAAFAGLGLCGFVMLWNAIRIGPLNIEFASAIFKYNFANLKERNNFMDYVLYGLRKYSEDDLAASVKRKVLEILNLGPAYGTSKMVPGHLWLNFSEVEKLFHIFNLKAHLWTHQPKKYPRGYAILSGMDPTCYNSMRWDKTRMHFAVADCHFSPFQVFSFPDLDPFAALDSSPTCDLNHDIINPIHLSDDEEEERRGHEEKHVEQLQEENEVVGADADATEKEMDAVGADGTAAEEVGADADAVEEGDAVGADDGQDEGHNSSWTCEEEEEERRGHEEKHVEQLQEENEGVGADADATEKEMDAVGADGTAAEEVGADADAVEEGDAVGADDGQNEGHNSSWPSQINDYGFVRHGSCDIQDSPFSDEELIGYHSAFMVIMKELSSILYDGDEILAMTMKPCDFCDPIEAVNLGVCYIGPVDVHICSVCNTEMCDNMPDSSLTWEDRMILTRSYPLIALKRHEYNSRPLESKPAISTVAAQSSASSDDYVGTGRMMIDWDDGFFGLKANHDFIQRFDLETMNSRNSFKFFSDERVYTVIVTKTKHRAAFLLSDRDKLLPKMDELSIVSCVIRGQSTVQCGMTAFGPVDKAPKHILFGQWQPACGAHCYFILLDRSTDCVTMTKADKTKLHQLNSWVSHFNVALSAEDLKKYYAIYEEFIIKGKEDLLDYLGKKSERLTWVSAEEGENIESFSPALTVCNRNSSRGGMFDVLEEIGAIYYNEVWHRGSIKIFSGQLVVLAGFTSDVDRFIFGGVRGSPVSNTWDSDVVYLVCDKWDNYKLFSVTLKAIVKVGAECDLNAKRKLYSSLQVTFLDSIAKKSLVRINSSPSKIKKDPALKFAPKPTVVMSKPPAHIKLNVNVSDPASDTNTVEFYYWSTFLDALWTKPNRSVSGFKDAFDRYCRNCENITECPPAVSREKFEEWRLKYRPGYTRWNQRGRGSKRGGKAIEEDASSLTTLDDNSEPRSESDKPSEKRKRVVGESPKQPSGVTSKPTRKRTRAVDECSEEQSEESPQPPPKTRKSSLAPDEADAHKILLHKFQTELKKRDDVIAALDAKISGETKKLQKAIQASDEDTKKSIAKLVSRVDESDKKIEKGFTDVMSMLVQLHKQQPSASNPMSFGPGSGSSSSTSTPSFHTPASHPSIDSPEHTGSTNAAILTAPHNNGSPVTFNFFQGGVPSKLGRLGAAFGGSWNSS